MNIIDIGIILFILSGAIIGLKRGFTKQLVSSIGFNLIVISTVNIFAVIT